MAWTLAALLLHSIVLCFSLQPFPGIVVPPALPTLNISTLPGLAKLNALVASVANASSVPALLTPPPVVPCTCGVFLTGQFTHGSRQQPKGYPALMQEKDRPFPCSPLGNKQCANECLGVIVKHLKDSANIICASIDRDCFKERATLWTKNCVDLWENSNMSAGREFCCKDGLPYKCSTGKH